MTVVCWAMFYVTLFIFRVVRDNDCYHCVATHHTVTTRCPKKWCDVSNIEYKIAAYFGGHPVVTTCVPAHAHFLCLRLGPVLPPAVGLTLSPAALQHRCPHCSLALAAGFHTALCYVTPPNWVRVTSQFTPLIHNTCLLIYPPYKKG